MISSGAIDFDSPWSFSADDGNAFLGSAGTDWAVYATWFLGEVAGAADTKAGYEYPFGKGGKIYASAVRAIRSRASANDADPVFVAAGHLLDAINAKAPKAAPGGLQRAYSTFVVKSVNKATRTITGIATTPTPDRMGDIVESQGAQFSLPLPLLWQHDATQPVGQVTAAKVSPAGIEVTCQFAQNTGQPTLDDRLDQAFAMVESGLVRGLSIGFAPKETAQIEGTWNCRFTQWEWLELSAVTIPANAEATITQIKAIDRQQRGVAAAPVVRLSNQPARPPIINAQGNHMNIAERIASLEGTRAVKASAATAILEGATGTLDATEQAAFDGATAEVEAIDADLTRCRTAERLSLASATGVGGHRLSIQAVARTKEILSPGIRFARVAKSLMLAKMEAARGIPTNPVDIVRQRYPHDDAVARVVKAAVDAATIGDPNWAGPLVGAESTVFADFAEFLRPLTILGRFGQGNIPALMTVPFRVRLLGQSSAASAGWVGEGKPAAMTRFAVAGTTLTPLKIVAIAAASMELVRDSSPAADVLIRNELGRASAERLDRDFIDPAKAAVANVSPASVTNLVVPSVSAGPDADSVRQDIGTITDDYLAANLPLTSAVFIMSQRIANKLSLMRNALGQKEFPDITPIGGLLEAYPVIASEWVSIAGESNGDHVYMVSAGDIYFADDGDTQIDLSTEASLEMSDAPSEDATAGTGASLVSLYQTNSVAFRATRTVNWALRRPVAVQGLSDVFWGNPSS